MLLLHHHRGQLVAERFAAACRHNNHCVVAGEDCRDDFLLTFAKFFEAEVLAQRVSGIAERVHVGNVLRRVNIFR